jgi:fumarate reductase subunit C
MSLRRSARALVLFIWSHMLLESSILIGKDAMYRVARFMERHYVLGGRPSRAREPDGERDPRHLLRPCRAGDAQVSGKLPTISRVPRSHDGISPRRRQWWLQVWTSVALFFLGSAHMIGVITRPGDIRSYESADHIVSEWMWPVYALLLIVVHLHAGVGIYRLALKWGLLLGRDPAAS